ncbi:MAG: 50S ribosomal protein L10 [Candidatus Omnitrophica bacterium]|nr:50S ribosomal protein L10 [Candidatus Omnitrophota bacterium]
MKRLTKKKKEEIVEKMSQEIQKNNINLVIGFSGLSVFEMQKIREALKDKGCKIQVVKNTLLERIYQKINFEDMCRQIEGPTFIVWTNTDDEIDIVKKIYDFQKQFGKMDVKAALVGNKLFSSAELSLIAKLPRKKEIQSKVIWILRIPMKRIINALNFPILRVISDLKQISENKRKERKNGEG